MTHVDQERLNGGRVTRLHVQDPREVLTRPAAPAQQTLVYGPHPDHVIDLWVPEAAAPPLVVLLHGGFWRAPFDRTHLRPMANALHADGFAVALPEYRRVGQPGGGWPGTFDDLAVCLDRLPALVAPQGVDLTRTTWVGHSAGGHLALWAASRHRLDANHPWHRHGPPPIRGVVSLAGVTNLTQCSDLGLDDQAADALVGGTPEDRRERYAAADPSLLLPAELPVVLLHGTADNHVPITISRSYRARAVVAGDRHSLVELPDTEHFALIDPLSAAWPTVRAAIHGLTAGF